jgi:tRNA(fMet)-specific endonuclease VapC
LKRYLLDTNVISDLVRNPQGQVASRIAKVGERSVCTSTIVAAELRFGAAKRGSERLTVPADMAYARLRAELEAAGAPIGGNDMLIAAHALATDCSVVTDNGREFARIVGLQVENWLR